MPSGRMEPANQQGMAVACNAATRQDYPEHARPALTLSSFHQVRA